MAEPAVLPVEQGQPEEPVMEVHQEDGQDFEDFAGAVDMVREVDGWEPIV